MLWAFTALACVVFSDLSAIQSNTISNKFTNEQIDTSHPTHFSICISYKCATSILDKKHVVESFSFLFQAKECISDRFLESKCQLQKKRNIGIANSIQFYFLETILHNTHFYLEHHS